MSERVMGFEVEIESVTEPIEVEIMSGTQGATTLAGLNDTLITSPQDGEALIFDETDNKWENKEIAPTFTEAEARANIVSGETLSVLFGKIKKFFSDLKTVAFTNDYNDLDNKPSIPSAQIQSDWTQTDDSQVDYIKHKPTLGTASEKDVPVSGNASTTEVVLGSDTRLSDSRPASDVSAWAKQPTKPTYSASEVGAIPSTEKGSYNGVAELDATGRVPSSQLPSYVDDVKTYNSMSDFPLTGEDGVIYIAKDTNKTYRWSGTAYVEVSESLALGETSSTAYRGDRGKTAYDHSQTTSGNPHNVTKTDVGLGNVGNFKAVSTESGQGLTETEKANARDNISVGNGLLSMIHKKASGKTVVNFYANQSNNAEFSFTDEEMLIYSESNYTVPPNVGTAKQIVFSGGSEAIYHLIPQNPTLSVATDISTNIIAGIGWNNIDTLGINFLNNLDTSVTFSYRVYCKMR